MKRLLIFALLGALVFSANASAKITTINEWIKGGKDSKSKYEDFANSFTEKTCQQVYGNDAFETKPEGKQCDSQPLGFKTCYYNCRCPSKWKSCLGNGLVGVGIACIEKDGEELYASCSCDSMTYKVCNQPSVGSGDSCTYNGTTLYSACTCPEEYNKICTNQIGGVGSDDFCNDDNGTHYKSCRCSDDYKICTGDAGEGTPCTLDSINKYLTCTYGEVSNVCRAVTDATPYDNSPEYLKHANAFRGIENTKIIIETQGDAATAANAAINFRPNRYIPTYHQYFGVGKWYLPAVGEMLYLSGAHFSKMTGIDDNNMTSIDDQPTNVINDETYNKVNAALITLQKNANSNKEFIPFLHTSNRKTSDYTYSAYDHWTSSYGWNDRPYFWAAPTFFNQKHSGVYQNRYSAGWASSDKNKWSWYHFVRPVLMLQSCFNDKNINIGDVVFTNMDVGSAESYNPSDNNTRYPVGIVYWISADKTLVRIISVKPVPFIGSGNQWLYDSTNNPDGNYSSPSYAGYRVAVVNEKHNGYIYDDVDIPNLNKDNWGCSALSNSSSCINKPQPRATMTCTPKIKNIDNEYEPEFKDHTNAFKGIEYTNAIIKSHPSATGSAAHLAAAFYGSAGTSHVFFGKGKWYLPSAGEMLYLAGANIPAMTSITDQITDENGNNDYETVNNSLTMTNAGIYSGCTSLPDKIWTSSEADKDNAYYWDSTDRQIKSGSKKDSQIEVRPVIMLRDPHFIGEAPQVGSVVSLAMESLNFPIDPELKVSPWRGHSSDYPIGVVYYVSPDQRVVRIIACKSASSDPVPWLSAGDTVDIQAIPNNVWDNVPQGTPLEMSHLFDGKGNTQKIINALHENALAAYAASQFYAPGVDENDPNFGKGKWYLPALGELMDIYASKWDYEYEDNWGTNNNNPWNTMSDSGYNDNYATGNIINKINDALLLVGDSIPYDTKRLWTSTPSSDTSVYQLNRKGIRYTKSKYPSQMNAGGYVRTFNILENMFFKDGTDGYKYPQIGDIIYYVKSSSGISYSDAETYTNLNQYNSNLVPVGVVVWVSKDQHSARIINLKDLRFKYYNTSTDFFNPENPYNTKDSAYVGWTTEAYKDTPISDVITIPVTGSGFSTACKNRNPGTSPVSDDECSLDTEVTAEDTEEQE